MKSQITPLGCHKMIAVALALLSLTLSLGACRQRLPEHNSTPTVVQSPAYPGPDSTRSILFYPAPEITPTPSAVLPEPTVARSTLTPDLGGGQPAATSQSFLPSIQKSGPTETPLSAPIPSPSAISAIDFNAIRAELRASGRDLGFSKIGFHVTALNDSEEEALYEYMRRLDQAGVPFFLKSANNAEPLYFAQQLMKSSGVPHTLVYRSTTRDVPEYELPAEQAAELHWQRHRDSFPPELDPSLVWIETLNEVDKTQSEWLARFALKTAELTMAEGFRWAAFGWASGEPEPEAWQTLAMLEFLRLAGNNPDRLAIALHEYSFLANDIADLYPFKVGRFLELFRIVDRWGIPRPTVLITEWGWSYVEVPPVDQALGHINWANSLYAPFPQVKGAAIWNLGHLGARNELSALVQPYVPRLTEYSLNTYFSIPMLPDEARPDPELYRP